MRWIVVAEYDTHVQRTNITGMALRVDARQRCALKNFFFVLKKEGLTLA